MLASTDRIGRPYVAPPGTPADKMHILRDAFAKVAKDRDALTDAMKLGTEIQYLPADETMKSLKYLMNQPEDIVKEFSKYIIG